jgi:YfiH family protein
VSEELKASLPGGYVLFTDRSDGNMSSVGGLDAEYGAVARDRLRDRLGLQALARGYQVHGSDVQIVAEMPTSEPDIADRVPADGQATSLESLGAMVLAADCLPVAISREGAIAMLHAGWRGLAAGVLESGTQALDELGASGLTSAERLVAVLGPCAGPCCYEVGPEVHAALGSDVREKAPIDLRAVARQKLEAAAVDQVLELGGCTICDERYFSHRREGDAAGRQAGVAWLS